MILKKQTMQKSKYILGSFYKFRNADFSIFKNYDFLLDSGAFTFMNDSSKVLTEQEFIDYTKEYASFINKNDIKKFVEMDLDSIFDYKFVLELRYLLEIETRKRCIPIWHHSRGKAEFIKMTKDYTYAGVGGIVTKEPIVKFKHKFKDLNKLAESNGCHLHFMGFTPSKGLEDYGIHSVDSTSWSSGSKFGQIKKFINGEMKSIKSQELGIRINNTQLNNNNIREWVKYQKWHDKH